MFSGVGGELHVYTGRPRSTPVAEHMLKIRALHERPSHAIDRSRPRSCHRLHHHQRHRCARSQPQVYPSAKRTWHFFYRGGPDRHQRNAKLGNLSLHFLLERRPQARRPIRRRCVPRHRPGCRQEGEGRTEDRGRVRQAFCREPHRSEAQATEPGRVPEADRQMDLAQLGRFRLDAVTTEVVQRLHHKMGGTPRQANFVMAVLRKMMNDAIALGWRKDTRNPVAGIKPYRENKRQRYLDRKEFARLWQVLQAEMAMPHNHDGILAIVLLLLTGRRRGEILNLTWDEVDLDNGRMTLKDSKVVRRRIPASSRRSSNCSSGPAPSEGSWAWRLCHPRARGKGRLVGLPHIWQRIRAKAGLDDVPARTSSGTRYASCPIDPRCRPCRGEGAARPQGHRHHPAVCPPDTDRIRHPSPTLRTRCPPPSPRTPRTASPPRAATECRVSASSHGGLALPIGKSPAN